MKIQSKLDQLDKKFQPKKGKAIRYIQPQKRNGRIEYIQPRKTN